MRPALEARAVLLGQLTDGRRSLRPAVVPLMYWSTPPDQPGTRMPKIEPMFASATDSITPRKAADRLQGLGEEHPLLESLSEIVEGSATGGNSRRPDRARALAVLVVIEAGAAQLPARPLRAAIDDP